MNKVIKQSIKLMLIAVLCVGTLAGFAYAQKSKPLIDYRFYMKPGYPSYDIAAIIMADLFKEDEWNNHPMIGIGEFDLDNDGYTEIIAHPTEQLPEEEGWFCQKNGLCPHYILQIREDSVQVLGILDAHTIERSNKITNNFWRLRVYDKAHPEDDPTAYREYEYKPEQDEYAPVE